MVRRHEHKVLALDDITEKGLSFEESLGNDDLQAGQLGYENKAFLAAQTIMSAFFSEDWVFITTDLLAREFCQPYVRVMRKTFVEGKLVLEPAETHPVQALLDDPAQYGDGVGFWYRAAVFYNLLGNCFIWYMRANNKFMIIPAHEMLIRFDDKTHEVQDYVWNGGGSDGFGNGVAFKKEDVLHIQRPNPASMWWGLSPFIPGHRSILFNRYSEEYLNSFFEKGATPQIIVETEITNSPDAIKTLAKSFELVNSGRKNQRRPLVLPKGAKASQINMTIADQKLIELINQNREVIINLLAIPKHALGLQATGSLGSEEHKTALRYMWQSSIKPMLKRFASALTKFMAPQLGKDFVIDYDTSDVEVSSEDMLKRTQYATGLGATHTINEIRQIVYERGPIEGGDIIPNVIPPTQAFPAPIPEPAIPEPLPAEAPAPLEETAMLNKFKGTANILAHTGFSEHKKDVDTELERTKDSLEKLAQDTLLEQLKIALKIIKENGVELQKTLDEDELRDRLEEAFDKEKWVKRYSEILSPTVDLGYNTQLNLVFNPKNREAIAALQAQTANGRKAILQKRALDTFANISRTTTDDIISKIAKGVGQGDTVAQIAQRLIDNFPEVSFKRSQVIARTETLTAVSTGQDSAMKNAAKVIPDAQKVWITANDSRVRDTHEDLHGEMVGVKEKFQVGKAEMSVPRDPRSKGYPEEFISCRCTVAIVSPEDTDLVDI